MNTLLCATNAHEKEIDGFYHCGPCLAYLLREMGYEKNLEVWGFEMREGDDLLAVSIVLYFSVSVFCT